MTRIVLFNKPFQVMSQFSASGDKRTLAEFIDIAEVYPAGRLDYDSEGLMVLTDDGSLQAKISDPRFKQPKTYLAQVEAIPEPASIQALQAGVKLKDGMSNPTRVKTIAEPNWLWPRNPPIRERKHIPTRWLEIEINEGRNRQVRRMVAAVGHPCLRLLRIRIADWWLDDLKPGEYRLLR